MEGEGARVIFQGAEITLRILEKGIKGVLQIVAMLAAMLQKDKLMGRTTMVNLLKKGEQLTVVKIPIENLKQFEIEAKKYGLLYNSIKHKDSTFAEIVFSTSQIQQFNSIIEQLGILKEDIPISEFAVDDKVETILTNIEVVKKNLGMSDQEIKDAMFNINNNNAEKFTPKNIQAFLMTQALLYNYSEKNKTKILDQMPEATVVMSKSRWEQLGRTINPDAQPIEIVMPEFIEGKKTNNFIKASAYDISQTNGSMKNFTEIYSPAIDENMAKELVDIAKEKLPYEIEYSTDIKDALFDNANEKILINNNITSKELLIALNRENIYVKAFNENPQEFSKENFDFRADSVAFMLGVKYGVDINDYSLDSISKLKEDKLLISEKNIAVREFSKVSKEMDKVIEKSAEKIPKTAENVRDIVTENLER